MGYSMVDSLAAMKAELSGTRWAGHWAVKMVGPTAAPKAPAMAETTAAVWAA